MLPTTPEYLGLRLYSRGVYSVFKTPELAKVGPSKLILDASNSRLRLDKAQAAKDALLGEIQL